MSRITGSEVASLMEAYQAVYAPQELTEEQVWEEVETWVNSLLEEGYDLSDYTWEEMYEEYITEIGVNFGGQKAVDAVNTRLAQQKQSDSRLDAARSQRFGGVNPVVKAAKGGVQGTLDKTSGKWTATKPAPAAAKPTTTPAAKPATTSTATTTSAKPATSTPAAAPAKPAAPASAAARPSGGAPAKVSPTPTKPAATAQTGDKTKDMATFAKANPALAAAAAERARTRGTSQSDNPLMKGMPGKRPMTPSVQSPTLAKDLGKGSGNQSLLNNPNASKAATPPPAAKVTPAAAPSVAQRASGLSLGSSQFKATAPEVKATNTIAAKTTSTPVVPTRAPVLQKQDFDVFDVIKGHLLDEGYADTEESALAIMANMSEEWRQSIVEAVDPDYTGPSQDPLSRASRAIGSAVKFAMGQQGAEVRAKQKGVPGNVFVKQSGPFSTKNVPTKGSFISDTEMKRRGQSTKPMGPIGQ